MQDNVDQKVGIYSVIDRFKKNKHKLISQTRSGGKDVLSFETPRNKELILLVGYTDKKPSNSKIFGKCLKWSMFKKDEEREGSNVFYSFIYFDKNLVKYRFFIVPNKEVVKYLKYEHKYWMDQNSAYKENSFRAFRLGVFYEKYNHDVPMVYEYEDRWDLIK